MWCCFSSSCACLVTTKMSTDSGVNVVDEQHSQDDVTDDDSCRLEFIEIVPLTRDTDGTCKTECDSGDWSAEVKQEILPVLKLQPEVVYCIVCYMYVSLCVWVWVNLDVGLNYYIRLNYYIITLLGSVT